MEIAKEFAKPSIVQGTEFWVLNLFSGFLQVFYPKQQQTQQRLAIRETIWVALIGPYAEEEEEDSRAACPSRPKQQLHQRPTKSGKQATTKNQHFQHFQHFQHGLLAKDSPPERSEPKQQACMEREADGYADEACKRMFAITKVLCRN